MTKAKRKNIRKFFARAVAVTALAGSAMILIFLVTNMSADTQKDATARTEQMQNDLILLENAIKKYPKL